HPPSSFHLPRFSSIHQMADPSAPPLSLTLHLRLSLCLPPIQHCSVLHVVEIQVLYTQDPQFPVTPNIMLCSTPRSHHQLLSVAVASAWGLDSRRQRREEEEEEQLGYAAPHAGQTFCPLLSSAALTLH
ncbi:hypothetical protein L3Q82_021795, partial [Scortum barcoo]